MLALTTGIRNNLALLEAESAHCSTPKGQIESGFKKVLREANTLGIHFVKIADKRYAKKYGVGESSCLVYFRKKFPSIYRGKQNGYYVGSLSCKPLLYH